MDIQEQIDQFLQIPEIKEIFSDHDIHWHVGEYSQGWYFDFSVPDYEKGFFLGAWNAWQAVKAQAVPEGFVLIKASDRDQEMLELIDQRDHMEGQAEELKDKLQALYGVNFGEHSSCNFPFQNAIDYDDSDLVLVPKEPTDKTIAHMINTPIEVNLLCDHADTFLSEGEACIAYQAMIEAQEPAPLKLGDLVKPIDHRYTLASGCERYPYAYVVNTNPFQLMSEEGDMYWRCTVEAGGYKLIKSNDQLPEAVSLRMIREGLLAPVETQEQSHD